eukprot:GHVP01019294.1.p1 GENE.GHVP01019294.1~~GHVP01019294.1.p1  ORF type:complete len:100 (-),score=8.11 GHVP01019294.1:39-338(-)
MPLLRTSLPPSRFVLKDLSPSIAPTQESTVKNSTAALNPSAPEFEEFVRRFHYPFSSTTSTKSAIKRPSKESVDELANFKPKKLIGRCIVICSYFGANN